MAAATIVRVWFVQLKEVFKDSRLITSTCSTCNIWDGTTPVEEILRAMDDLVRAGKVLYVGISDTPAWQISRMQAIADLRGWSPLVALQIEYSLVERTTERELIPMANAMELGVIPWSPLGGGLLSGRYPREDFLNKSASTGFQGSRKAAIETLVRFTERNLQISHDANNSPS